MLVKLKLNENFEFDWNKINSLCTINDFNSKLSKEYALKLSFKNSGDIRKLLKYKSDNSSKNQSDNKASENLISSEISENNKESSKIPSENHIPALTIKLPSIHIANESHYAKFKFKSRLRNNSLNERIFFHFLPRESIYIFHYSHSII